jgi:hypothetical protein
MEKYDHINDFINGFAKVKLNDKFGFIMKKKMKYVKLNIILFMIFIMTSHKLN